MARNDDLREYGDFDDGGRSGGRGDGGRGPNAEREIAAIAASRKHVERLSAGLDKFLPTISQVVVGTLRPEELTRLALNAACRDFKLAQCTLESVCLSLLNAAAMELRPDGREGHLIPFRNNRKGGRFEASFMPGYRGLVKLAYKSGIVDQFDAHTVRERDTFDFAYGTDAFLRHRPAMKDRGDIVASYAMVRIKGTGHVFVVLDHDDLEKRRKASQKGRKNEGPWAEWRDEMSLKSACIALSKLAPLGTGFDLAAAAEEATMRDATYVASTIDVNKIAGSLPDVTLYEAGTEAEPDDGEPYGEPGDGEGQSESDKLAERLRSESGGKRPRRKSDAPEKGGQQPGDADDSPAAPSGPLSLDPGETPAQWCERMYLSLDRIPTTDELDAIADALANLEGVKPKDRMDLKAKIDSRRDKLMFG